MHTGNKYSAFEIYLWTLKPTAIIVLICSIPTTLYHFDITFEYIPWQPIALLGTALSFIVGFKNNASYGRIWEARQIYGAIVNDSRSFGYTVRDALGLKHSGAVQRLFYRHFAWLTAMRFQLREPRAWENMNRSNNRRYRNSHYSVPEWGSKLEVELEKYLNGEELQYVLSKKNRATQLMALQSKALAKMRADGTINDFQWESLQAFLVRLTESQGKAERIKNFPYPRNFASVTTYLMLIFVVLLPFGLLKEFNALGEGTSFEGYSIWLNIPVCSIVAWVFFTLDEVGESSVNPFEGNANDVPITQISRTIEIDMRDMLDETDLPAPITPKNNIVL